MFMAMASSLVSAGYSGIATSTFGIEWATYNGSVDRRTFLLLLPALHAETSKTALRGKLVKGGVERAADGKLIALAGEDDAVAVWNDPRVIGSDFEVEGRMRADGVFEAAPMWQAPLFVYKDGKRLYVTYWCDVCAIRTYTPGICWCCREDTAYDPRDRKD
jgi:hypothetical protein